MVNLIVMASASLPAPTLADDNAFYVPDHIKEEGKRNDPLIRCEKEWISRGYYTPEEIEAVKAECLRVVDDAVDFAESSPLPEPEEALEGVYAE